MWETYWHTCFIGDKKQKNNSKPNVTDPNYEGPNNLWHYTIHEYNEAIFFAMKEYSSYVNFSQIENATYNFIIDELLRESYADLKEANKVQ